MKLKLLDYLFAFFVISVSLTPILPLRGWQGYGPLGEFYYTGDLIQLRYNDPSLGNDKPHVFVADAGRPVSLIEFSDHNSYVNGANVYTNFTAKTRLDGVRLKAFYNSSFMSFVKTVEPRSHCVKVAYMFNQTAALSLTLWRWYFSSVGPFNMPITRSLKPDNVLNFSIAESGKVYSAQLSLSPRPENVTVSGVLGEGVNKIVLDFKAENVTVEVKLLNPQSLSIFFTIDVRESRYLYPIIAIALSSIYLWLKNAAVSRYFDEKRRV